jgi:hypothetical protein
LTLLVAMSGSSVKENKMEAVKMLLEHGAVPDDRDAKGNDVFEYIRRMKDMRWGDDFCAELGRIMKEAIAAQEESRKAEDLARYSTGISASVKAAAPLRLKTNG